MAEEANRIYKGIRSKNLVRPRKYISIFNKMLYVGVGFIVLGASVAFILSGFQFAALLSVVVPVSIAYGYSRQEFTKLHYEFCLLDLELEEEELKLRYYSEGKQDELLHIPYRSIKEIECVEDMCCIRLVREEVLKEEPQTMSMLVFLEKELLKKIYSELDARVKVVDGV